MMPENNNDTGGNQAQATALLSQIPFGAIIGAPLKAAVDAQAAAAVACYDFVRKIGFTEETVTGADGKPLTTNRINEITFTFVRDAAVSAAAAGGGDVATTRPVKLSITVPILTIMPLPFIRIESLTVEFKASLSAVDERSQTEKQGADVEGKLEGSVGFPLWKVGVSGSISSKKDSSATNTSKYSVEHTMDVTMRAVQDDMPAGLAKLLSFMNDSITASRPV